MKPTAEQVAKVQQIKEAIAEYYWNITFTDVAYGSFLSACTTCSKSGKELRKICFDFADSLLLNTPLKDLCLKGELLTDKQVMENYIDDAEFATGQRCARAQHDACSVTIKDVLEGKALSRGEALSKPESKG